MMKKIKPCFQFSKKSISRPFFVFLILFFLLLAGYSGYFFSQKVKKIFFSCLGVDITCVDCYSPSAKKKLVAFVQERMIHVNYLSFSASSFYSDLKDRFGFVSRVTIEKRGPKGFFVRIECVKPVMQLNQNLILATDCGVYEKSLFAQNQQLRELAQITVPHIRAGMKVTAWTAESLKFLVSRFSDQFDCIYCNSSMIRLIPRVKKLFCSVVINEDAMVRESNFNTLDLVAVDVLQRGFCSLKQLETKRRSIELDARFDRRIIVKIIDHAKRGGKAL